MPRRPLTHDDVRQFALALPGAHEGAHMGHADLRVRDRIFASLPNDPAVVHIKIAPANLDILVRSDPETYRDVWGGRWVGVRLTGTTADALRELLLDAWRLTAPTSLAGSDEVRRPAESGSQPERAATPSTRRRPTRDALPETSA
ncbi:MAG TPA: MmcQ/YjbR family DNA-binding protein [Gemmatimonadaceae bacterium]|nr:MmcQ/YjbR family DNA-binding protein [Gemmatimonadaceae bacterium]